jgi:hypothetical protein
MCTQAERVRLDRIVKVDSPQPHTQITVTYVKGKDRKVLTATGLTPKLWRVCGPRVTRRGLRVAILPFA